MSRGNGFLPTTGSRADVTEMSTEATRCISVCPQLYLYPGQPQKEHYCSHCHSCSHNLKECWRKPSRGSCFECPQYGCWRGNKNCPGKPKTTYLAQAHTSPIISLAVNNKMMRAVIDTGSCYTHQGSNSK